ncbi:hypothetical protein FAIPA1_160060 [Frankia sp. AiPs1]
MAQRLGDRRNLGEHRVRRPAHHEVADIPPAPRKLRRDLWVQIESRIPAVSPFPQLRLAISDIFYLARIATFGDIRVMPDRLRGPVVHGAPRRHRRLRSSRPASPLPHRRPATPSPLLRVTTDRPRKTFMSLLQSYEGTNQTHYPVEATSPRTSSATAPDNHHAQ